MDKGTNVSVTYYNASGVGFPFSACTWCKGCLERENGEMGSKAGATEMGLGIGGPCLHAQSENKWNF